MMMVGRVAVAALVMAAAGAVAAAGTPQEMSESMKDGNRDGIAQVLPGAVAGDPVRGRAIVANRQVGLCLLCHSGPIPEERFQGDLAPDLSGAGDRSTAAQLRLRIVDAGRIVPGTIMPSYFKTEGLARVAAAFRDKPLLGAQQIEDVVAYLQTLRAAATQGVKP
jgi:sulfur-oxidizing protein SoxX